MYDLTMIPFTRLVLLLIIYRRNLKVYGLQRGTFAWRGNDSLLSMLWKDRKSILFSLSIHQPEQGEPAKRKVKRVNIYQETEFLCPKLVNGYNSFMGGVGYNDQI